MTLPYNNLTKQEIEHEYPEASRTLKRQLIKRGYTWQISLYGVQTNTATKKSEYRRIEILSNKPYTRNTLVLIYGFFGEFIPPYKYSIWTYNASTDDLDMAKGYD